MSLVTYPRTPLWIRIVSLLGALGVGAILVHLVLNFGWYASGLAAYKHDEARRAKTPIPVSFADPNAQPAPEPPPAPAK